MSTWSFFLQPLSCMLLLYGLSYYINIFVLINSVVQLDALIEIRWLVKAKGLHSIPASTTGSLQSCHERSTACTHKQNDNIAVRVLFHINKQAHKLLPSHAICTPCEKKFGLGRVPRRGGATTRTKLRYVVFVTHLRKRGTIF